MNSDSDQTAFPKSIIRPISGQKEITKIIAVSSDKVLPADAAQAVYASGYPVTLKETCYGLVLTGTKENIDAAVKIVLDLDKNRIFVKDRGFPAGDPRRCRAVRSGGQRPGFYTLHSEISRMGTIGDALDNYEAGVEKTEARWPNRPSALKMEDYIEEKLGVNKKKPKTTSDGKTTAEKKTKTEKKTAEKKTSGKKAAGKSTAEKSTAKKSTGGKSAAEKPAGKKKTAKK